MKAMKKILALALAGVMTLGAASAVLAAETTKVTVTSSTEDNAKYAAYKLLNATNDATDKTKFAYTLNDKYTDILKTATGKTTQADIVDYISKLDVDGIRSFANTVYAAIQDAGLDADGAANASGKTADFGALAQGYYLIAETQVGTVTTEAGTQTGSFSLVMLDTKGQDTVDIQTKEDVPKVEKKVEEKNDSTGYTSGWQDAADYDIGDEINYQLTGTLSAKYADYETYYYEFHDTMNKLTYKDGSVKVYAVNDEAKTDITSSFTPTWTASTKKLDVKCDDLKTISVEGLTITASTKIVVEYTATLDTDAVIGSAGNPNTVKLEYSNNPYDEGTGNTPEDKVTVFTYKIVANKVDKDGAALAGAGFTLYKKVGSNWVQQGDEVTGVTTFNFNGKDAGVYRLEESTVPAGYNKADDIYFLVEGTYDPEAADPKLTALEVYASDKDGNKGALLSDETSTATFTATVTGEYDGNAITDVVNNSGTELPHTGGMGTTIFYIIGAILVIGAGILLVSKKRMSAN